MVNDYTTNGFMVNSYTTIRFGANRYTKIALWSIDIPQSK